LEALKAGDVVTQQQEEKIKLPPLPRVRFNFKQSTFITSDAPEAERPGPEEPTQEAVYLQKQVARNMTLTKERLSALDAKNELLLLAQKEDVHSMDSFDSDSDKDAAEEVAAGGGKDKENEASKEAVDDANEYPSSSDSDEWSGASESDDDESEDEDRGGRGRKDKKAAAASSSLTNTDMQECGPVMRLLRAVSESTFPPVRQEWSNHIVDMGMTKVSLRDAFKNRRVEQIDLATDEVLYIWDSVGIASKRLNIPATQINSVLAGKLDNGGGFKWRLATANSSVHEYKDEDDEDIANAKKKDKNWQEKMHKVSKEYLNGGKLRDYQVDGLNWLLRCWYTKLSSILADGECSLGRALFSQPAEQLAVPWLCLILCGASQ
jgi:SWI/SNF-related matrix-associated actin-dependent regulator of chromatin subfamily A member 5